MRFSPPIIRRLAVAACAPLLAAPASADTPPPRHERASSWRTVVTLANPDPEPAAVTVAAPQLVSGPVTPIRPAIRPAAAPPPVVTASLGPHPSVPAATPRLLGPGHALDGIASYYWQDQMTASGERFDRHALTAAHRTLPLGTRVRVTHARTGRSVVVRINDRGPFKKGRVIDLSEAAAQAIGMTAAGLAHVKVDVVAAR